LSEAASFTISLRPGSDGFGFKLIRKRDQPSLYSTSHAGHQRKLATLLAFIAQSFDLGHSASIFGAGSENQPFGKALQNFAMLRA
jgi:hypothetical protein